MQTTEVSHSGGDLASLYGSMMLQKQKLERQGDSGELSRNIESFIYMLDRASFEGEFSEQLLEAANRVYNRILKLSPPEKEGQVHYQHIQKVANDQLPIYPMLPARSTVQGP